MSLFSPLEGFKSFAYDYTFTNINSSGENFNLGGGFFNNLNNNDFFLIPIFWSQSHFFVSYLFFLALLYFYFSVLDFQKTKEGLYTFFSVFVFVIIVQLVFHVFGIQSFYYYEISKNINGILNFDAVSFQSGFINIFFIKESVSFISLFLLVWLLSNWNLTDTLLIPKTVIEILDEYIYKANLNLFSDVLDLKNNHEVKQYQEFFIKTHGLLLFILIANVQGMVPYSTTITASFVNTFYVGLAVFINIILTIITEKGVLYFFSLFYPPGCPLVLVLVLSPIEFISYSFRVASLSTRLFANMMAGHTLMKVVAGFGWSSLLMGDMYILVHYVPFIFLFIFTVLETAVAFIQTYIFVILIYLYLSDIFVGH